MVQGFGSLRGSGFWVLSWSRVLGFGFMTKDFLGVLAPFLKAPPCNLSGSSTRSIQFNEIEIENKKDENENEHLVLYAAWSIPPVTHSEGRRFDGFSPAEIPGRNSGRFSWLKLRLSFI